MAALSTAARPSVVSVPGHAEGLPVLDFLTARFPAIERETWRTRLAAGKVLAEHGSALAAESLCRAGERLFYFREVEEEPVVPYSEAILLETANFLIVDKPPFLPVHPTGPYVRETLLGRLERSTGLAGLAAAHRLDLETAGLVLVTKREEARGLYHQLFAQGGAIKEYHALAAGPEQPRQRCWRVENRLERGEPWFRMRVMPGEVNAKTEIELLSRQDGVGRFRLRPETGKKHQLRVHMAGLGFPILGDRYYPDLLPPVGATHASPLRLLAARLAFRNPVTGEAIEVQSRRILEGDNDGFPLATGAALR